VTLAFVNVIASVLCEAISPMKRGIASAEKLPRNDTITYLFTTTNVTTQPGDWKSRRRLQNRPSAIGIELAKAGFATVAAISNRQTR